MTSQTFADAVPATSTLQIEAISPAVGGIVSGVDLTKPLATETVRALRAGVLEHGALFFRDQDLTREQTADFMARFGTLGTDPFSVAAKHPTKDNAVHNMPTYAQRRATAVWHMDSTLAPEPAALLALRALELPPSGGGDTCWGSMYAAYETLSEPVKAMIDGLSAEHSAYKTLPLLGGSNTGYLQADMRSVHPVVRVHPETGRKALFVNELWTESIVGLSRHESDSLLAMLWAHSRSEEFTMRWRWRVNDIVLWDNRAFQHYAVMDYEGNRVLQKSYVQGDRPRGPFENG
ncbi:TauD/TfdA dioxygenase family protein [Novosphingobium sp. JCM 18896]|uniref:TauD/TfdA dioxygenase family protein n=1 Tax=Novosphingobium sp. JCM 18896 TaxID=2989731 RepID=UPI002222233A|nr:TauD/TfdA family dioxygenase [Novosphingobium sp. JCM 18896]MCW1430739.1 TauD/TfdA family dioxygenase [Novosphingobium sp. JCM 18896]